MYLYHYKEDDCRIDGCEEHYVCRILDGQYTCVCENDYTRTNCTEMTGRYHFLSSKTIVKRLFKVTIK
jgi:hypothetical protein